MMYLNTGSFQRKSTRISDVATNLLQGFELQRPDKWVTFSKNSPEHCSLAQAASEITAGEYEKPAAQLVAALAIGDTAGFIQARTMLARDYAEAWVEAMNEQGAWDDARDDDSYDREQFLAWQADRAQDARAHNASLMAAA